MAYSFNIGHRLFPRDATSSIAPNPASFFHPTPHRPGLCSPGCPLAGPAFGYGDRNLPSSLSGGPMSSTPPDNPLTSIGNSIHARAGRGAEQSRKPLFGEPGGLRYPRAELAKAKTSR